MPHFGAPEGRLPVSVWGKIGEDLDIKEWAKACGINQAAYAARRPLVAAEVRSGLWDGKRVCMPQLQLEKWPGCHSLFLNLQWLHETGELTPEQSAEIENAAKDIATLRCLHIIGRSQVPLMDSNVEGVLMRLLAKHALVLTLQVRTLTMPLDFPSLQHLVLDLGAFSHRTDKEQDDWGPLLTISRLKGLRTLYIQAPDTTIQELTNLRRCVDLQYVALKGVKLKGRLCLPKRCALHVMNGRKNIGITPSVAHLVTGLTICHGSPWIREWMPGRYSFENPGTQKLKQLRLTLKKGDFGGPNWRSRGRELDVNIGQYHTPVLEVLELNMQCSGQLSVSIDDNVPLKSLVLMAKGTLYLGKSMWYQGVVTPIPINPDATWISTSLEQMYLQSNTRILPSRSNLAEDGFYIGMLGLEVRPVEYARQGHCWTARMPAGFQPSSLQECWCSACPECLARAAVPIMCEQAWTRDGFAKHLRSL